MSRGDQLNRSATSLAARALKSFLPYETGRRLTHELMSSYGDFELLGELARRNGFIGLVAEGDCGTFLGAVDDGAAILRYARDGHWAPHEQARFVQLFATHGGTYLDVGANIGLTLIPIARNAAVNCIAFEPNPDNFRFLEENVAVNCEFQNVSLHNLALFDKDALLPMELSEGHSGDHRLLVGGSVDLMEESTRRRIDVRAVRLDSLLPCPPRRPFGVKIDTQGAEPFVVAGGSTLLASADFMAIEFWPYSMKRMGGDVDALLSFFRANFRQGSATRGDANEEPRWSSIEAVVDALAAIYTETNSIPRAYFDVLLTK
jgi:FkbM family methyltransferase